MEVKEKIMEELSYVFEPELGVNIVDLGFIYDIKMDENNAVTIIMCIMDYSSEEMVNSLIKGIKYALSEIEEITEVTVQMIQNPKWSPKRMKKELREQLIGIG